MAGSGSRFQPPTLCRLDQRREPKEGSPRAKSHVLSALFPKVPAAVLAVWYGIRYGVLGPGDSRSAELKIPAPRNHRNDLVHLQVHGTQRILFRYKLMGFIFLFLTCPVVVGIYREENRGLHESDVKQNEHHFYGTF